MAAHIFVFGFLFLVCCTGMCHGTNNTGTDEGLNNKISSNDTGSDANATTTDNSIPDSSNTSRTNNTFEDLNPPTTDNPTTDSSNTSRTNNTFEDLNPPTTDNPTTDSSNTSRTNNTFEDLNPPTTDNPTTDSSNTSRTNNTFEDLNPPTTDNPTTESSNKTISNDTSNDTSSDANSATTISPITGFNTTHDFTELFPEDNSTSSNYNNSTIGANNSLSNTTTPGTGSHLSTGVPFVTWLATALVLCHIFKYMLIA